jgi:hypothetical protein
MGWFGGKVMLLAGRECEQIGQDRGLYQGMTLVVPLADEGEAGFSP